MSSIFLFSADCGEKGKKVFEVYDTWLSETGKFTVTKSQNYSGTYHPEKVVYTGATVGGVHTGGIHKEEAYVSVKSSSNGNGYIEYFDPSIVPITKVRIDSVTLSERLLNEAKKNPILAEMIVGDTISLIKPFTSEQLQRMQSAVMGGYNAYSQVEIANIQTSRYISYDYCVEVANFLNRALSGEFTPERSEVFEKVAEHKKKQDKQNTLIGCLVPLGFVLFIVAVVVICAVTA